jgi:hypothetical protein
MFRLAKVVWVQFDMLAAQMRTIAMPHRGAIPHLQISLQLVVDTVHLGIGKMREMGALGAVERFLQALVALVSELSVRAITAGKVLVLATTDM